FFVCEDRVARPHYQVGKLSEAVDHALGDAVRKILGLRILVRVDEGQDGDGLYRLIALAEVKSAGDDRKQRGQCDTSDAPTEPGKSDYRDPFFGRWRRDNDGAVLQALQIVEQFSGRLISLLAVFAERFEDDPLQRLRDFGHELRERRRL